MQTSDIISIAGGVVGSIFRVLAKSNRDAISDHVDDMLKDQAEHTSSGTSGNNNSQL